MQELMSITVGALLEQVAERFPNREAVAYTDRDYRRSWREFDDEVNRVAKGLMAHGIARGDKVAIWASNVPEWMLTLFACCKIGAVLVTVNTAYKEFEVEYLLRQSDSKLLVMIDGFKSNSYVETMGKLCKGLSCPGGRLSPMLPCLDEIVYAGAGSTPSGMTAWSTLLADGAAVTEQQLAARKASVDPQDVVNMQYTSGTTGFPKGVMLTHYNIVNNGKSIGDCMGFTEQDKLCIVVPFFHCFGLVLGMMACLTHATSMVPVDIYSPVKVMEAITSQHCTAVHGVPTMFIAMLEHAEFGNYDFSSLRTGIMAGSPCPIKVMQQVIDKMNMHEITITYGQTEASPATTMTSTQDSLELRVATVGRHMPHVETKIVDPETGDTLEPGQTGEFCSRGYNTMRGYYKMEEATRQVIDKDGWLHSGDLATVDKNGYYKITGRIKDMIIRGGENIYPKEIEEFIYTLPQVQDVQVIGVPSKQYGEEVMACVILRQPGAMTEEELKTVVAGHLARHKVPKYVAFVEQFPMTASGKIQKYRLREWAVEQYGLGASEETA
ncbi:MAG: AMP-binding protein [Angelakisella sp.]